MAVVETTVTGAGKDLQALKDPVCGMTVTEHSEHHVAEAGKHTYFCSAGCKTKFSADPAKYTLGRSVAVAKMPAPALGKKGEIYTCPMHSEIRQSQPGNCPICGMTLEPLIPELEEGENKELIDFNAAFGGRCH